VRELERRKGITPEADGSSPAPDLFDASGVHTISRDVALPSAEQAIESIEEMLRRNRGEPGNR
jgi:hypothetical protein